MNRNILTIPVAICIVSLIACGTGPKPIAYGKDQCVFCKMTIMDKRFGCQIVNTKGKPFHFDDLNCLLLYKRSGAIPVSDIAGIYVADHLGENKLMPAEEMYYVASENLRSPMAGNIAAYSDKDSAMVYMEKLDGKLITWTEIDKDE